MLRLIVILAYFISVEHKLNATSSEIFSFSTGDIIGVIGIIDVIGVCASQYNIQIVLNSLGILSQ